MLDRLFFVFRIRVLASLLGALALVPVAWAGDISLSLNLALDTPGDLNSGGTWLVVGKAGDRGIAGLIMEFDAGSLNFDPGTGFLTPAGFEVERSGVFGSRLETVQGDDLTDRTLDVGVVGVFASDYVDDPNLVPISGNPDLGSFTGGVRLAEGTFDPGQLPAWFGAGGASAAGNLFVDGSSVPVQAENVLTTVRAIQQAFVVGDLDCDGDVDFDDIDEFVLGLQNPQAYEDQFGVPPETKGDTDGDGDLDFDDVAGFVGLLTSGGQAVVAVPEPATPLLLLLGTAGLLIGRGDEGTKRT